MQRISGEKPGEQTLEAEEREENWDWELGSKTGNGSWEEKWKLDEILVERACGGVIRFRYPLW